MVQVVDRFGNPVPEVSVAWQVITGGGEVSEALTPTDDDRHCHGEVDPGEREGSPATDGRGRNRARHRLAR